MIFNNFSKKLIYLFCAIAAFTIIIFSLINSIIAYKYDFWGGEPSQLFNEIKNNSNSYEDTIIEDSIMRDVVSKNK